jgi:hypothetical protein
MALTEAQIAECTDDEALFALLGEELTRRLRYGPQDGLDEWLEDIRTLPVGLRAMAAIYELDVSICHDDLAWHFANWHHHGYAKETIWALRELEALEAADIFEQAYVQVQPWWNKLGELLDVSFDAFVRWYPDSSLKKAMMPLTHRMWTLCGKSYHKKNGLLATWVPYARKYPDKVATPSRLVIVTGGQSGVDRAALDVARVLAIPYAGFCPRGGWAEDFPDPPGLLARYPRLRETPLADPAQRTEWNVRDSDAVLILAHRGGLADSQGTALAHELATREAKPLIVLGLDDADAAARAARWLNDLVAEREPAAPLRLGIGGPRESEVSGTYAKAFAFLQRVLRGQ